MESSGFQGSSGRGVLPCLSSRASRASRGISNPEPLLFGRRSFGLLSKSDTMTKESLNRAAGGRCIAAGRWYAKAPSPVPSPPVGSRGRGPWSGRGSQRVKPRLVSPFEKRRLFFKGQGFLRVVCPKARFSLPRQQRFQHGDPSTRYYSLGMTDRVGRRDSGVTTRAQPCVVLKRLYDVNSPSTPSSWRSVRRGR